MDVSVMIVGNIVKFGDREFAVAVVLVDIAKTLSVANKSLNT